MDKSVKSIVIEWLKANNCNGLCNDDCGCGLHDFEPCSEMRSDCVAAVYNEAKDIYVPKQFEQGWPRDE